MTSYDNPAGRLHALAKQKGNGALVTAWANVLGVEQADVPLHLGAVGRLVNEVQRAAEETNPEELMPTVTRYRHEWWKPIFPADQSLNSQLRNVMPEAAALDALRMLAANLHLAASEGPIPDDDQLDELRESLQEAIVAVRDTQELPDLVKHAISERLFAVQRAIEHIEIGGPGAVACAMDALIGTIVLRTPPQARNSSVFKKVGKFFGLAWIVFMAGPNVERAIEAWGDFPHQLTEAAGEVVHTFEGEAVEEPAREVAEDGASPATEPVDREPTDEDATGRHP